MSERGYESTEQRPDEGEQKEQSLPISMRRRDDQGIVEIGVTIEGAFVPLGGLKTGHLDKLVQQARDKAEAESKSDSQG